MEKRPAGSCGSAALEQFLLLSKTTKGAAATELIRQALEAPGIYVFSELLEMPNITEVWMPLWCIMSALRRCHAELFGWAKSLLPPPLPFPLLFLPFTFSSLRLEA